MQGLDQQSEQNSFSTGPMLDWQHKTKQIGMCNYAKSHEVHTLG